MTASADTRPKAIIEALGRRRETVATAESLTAGLCCATLVTVPGASVVVRGGLIVYATDLKHTLADVPTDVLDSHGPVSEPTAAHLAVGAASRCAADWGIGLTGVAGPDSQDGQPVGTVWVATAYHGAPRTRLLRLAGDRAAIRRGAVDGALALLTEHLATAAR